MKAKSVPLAVSIMLLAAMACNLPASQTGDLAATVTAQALLLQTPSGTAAPLSTAAPSATATPSVPEVSVTSATNCRTGPGTGFDLVFTANPGQTFQIVGKYSPGNYWIINNPAGGTCWLWGQYAVVSGNTGALPEFPPPATPTAAEPAAPRNLKGSATCSPSGTLFTSNVHVSLSWTDVATNEDGYHIYRNDTLLATLSANSTSFSDDTTLTFIFLLGPTPPPPPTIKYGVEAFNGAGKSDRKDVKVGCP